MAPSRGLPMGPGPRPTTGDEFTARMRGAAATTVVSAVVSAVVTAAERVGLAGVGVIGLELAAIDAVLDGQHLDSLEVDLTGIEITLPGMGAPEPDAATGDGPGHPVPIPPPTHRTEAMLRSASISAHPAIIAGAPLDLDVALVGVPFAWVDRADGTLDLDVSADTDARREVRGAATLTIAQTALAPLVTRVVNVALAGVGASVSGLEIAMSSPRGDTVDVDATARAGYGLLGATIRMLATVSIVDGHRVRLADLNLSTGNPLAGALLGLARGELHRLEGQEYDLAAMMPVELRAIEAHLELTAEALTLRTTVGR